MTSTWSARYSLGVGMCVCGGGAGWLGGRLGGWVREGGMGVGYVGRVCGEGMWVGCVGRVCG